MAKILRIHHIGIAVKNSEESSAFWQDALGLAVDHTENVVAQKSKVTFLPVGQSEVELVQPTDEDSTIAKFLTDRGPGIHHICLQVDDIEGMLQTLQEKGIRLINSVPMEEPGRKMAFIHPKSTGGVLVELYQVV